MKLHALQAFITAIRFGSLRKAAVQLQMSQPALSKLVRELELEVSAQLLVRKSQGVEPTAPGKVLYQHALAVAHELDLARDHIRQLGGQMKGELKVIAVPVAMMLLMPEAVRTFSRTYPDISLQLREELFIEQLQPLRAGEVDVVVGGIPKGLANGEFLVEELMTTAMVAVAERSSPYAKATSLDQLRTAPWIYTGETPHTGYAAQLFAKHHMPAPPAGAVVNSTLTLLSLLGTGNLVGLMPQELVNHPLVAGKLVPIHIKEGGVPVRVGAMVRSDSHLTLAVRQFISHLHRAAHQLTAT